MTKHEIGVLTCRFAAILATMQTLRYIGDVSANFLYLQSLVKGSWDPYLFARVLLPIGLFVLFANFTVILWFYAPKLSDFIFRDMEQDPYELSPTYYEWHTTATSLLGLYIIATSFSNASNISSFILSTFTGIMKFNILIFIILFGGMFQITLGLLFVFRSREITRFVLRLPTPDSSPLTLDALEVKNNNEQI